MSFKTPAGNRSPFEIYQDVRTAVAAVRDPQASAAGESEQHESPFALSPESVQRLRLYAAGAPGHRDAADLSSKDIRSKFLRLWKRDTEGLFVSEPRDLGGFGVESDGSLCNGDTLRYYESMIALHRAAVLQEFRQTARRGLVCEVGAGYGGFGYQFKALCPKVTYLVCDTPENIVIAATYLASTMPAAIVGFEWEMPAETLLCNWATYDFIFVPLARVAAATLPRIDLVVMLTGLDTMPAVAVADCVETAYDSECPFVYGVRRGAFQPAISGAAALDVLRRFYWIREQTVLPQTRAQAASSWAAKQALTHLFGWRRIRT